MTIATFYIGGEALEWYQWLYTTHQLTNWFCFTKDLLNRFGSSMYESPGVTINKLVQTTSVAAYIAYFECLSARTPKLSPENLLDRFIGGLKDEIQRELVMLCPTTLRAAMGMARIADQKLHPHRTSSARPPGSRPFSPAQ
ncbi:hypothetical protein QQ045_013063 [Rhodiola kirilowii]